MQAEMNDLWIEIDKINKKFDLFFQYLRDHGEMIQWETKNSTEKIQQVQQIKQVQKQVQPQPVQQSPPIVRKKNPFLSKRQPEQEEFDQDEQSSETTD